jgi:ribokinase
MNALTLTRAQRRHDVMIGTGGIGSGSFFLLNGDHTLGREESRSGRFLDKNDYCKLHIIAHYVKALLGSGFTVVPVGKVGNDDVGRKLITEMKNDGLSVEHVGVDPARHTLFSFCFLYPDKSGGNMTTDDSACASVDAAYVQCAEQRFAEAAGRGVALAAPEVSLEARAALLDLATKHGFFRVASFTSGEMPDVLKGKLLRTVDLLCINLDEAAAGLDTGSHSTDPAELVRRAAGKFSEDNPKLRLTVTNGKGGSYLWDGGDVVHRPAEKVEVVSTAGAGDAFTAGMIAGTVAGLDWTESLELASLTGACSVTSPHTINKELDRIALRALVQKNGTPISSHTRVLLEDGQ